MEGSSTISQGGAVVNEYGMARLSSRLGNSEIWSEAHTDDPDVLVWESTPGWPSQRFAPAQWGLQATLKILSLPTESSTVAGLEKRVGVLERRLADMERDRLQRRSMAEEPVFELDAAAVWLRDHPDEVYKHRGMRVAVHPGNGIVASARDYGSLYEQVEKKGLLGNVVFDSIPDW